MYKSIFTIVGLCFVISVAAAAHDPKVAEAAQLTDGEIAYIYLRGNQLALRSLSVFTIATDPGESLIAPPLAKLRRPLRPLHEKIPNGARPVHESFPKRDRSERLRRNAATRCSRPKDAVSCSSVISSKSRVERVANVKCWRAGSAS
jgi:hypothetical protein